MKRNVKYIGGAVAAALLAAGAPVVIPAVIPTANVTVNADGIDYNPPLSITTFLTDFMDQFSNQYVSNTDVFVAALKQKLRYIKQNEYSYFDSTNPAHVLDLQNDPAILMLKSKPGSFPLENGSNYYYRDVLGSLTLTDGNGNQIMLRNGDDYEKAIQEFTDNEIKFPITVEIKFVSSKSSDDGVGTYNPPSLETPGVTSDMTYKKISISMSRFDVTEDDTTPMVTAGTSLTDTALTNNKNAFKVTDKYADTAGDGARTPIYGKSLFAGTSDGKTAAISYAKSAQFKPDSTSSGDVSSDVLNSSGQILKAGKYYQTVSYKLDNGNDAAIEAMLKGTTDPETSQKVSLYKVFANGNNTELKDGTDFVYNQSAGMITFIRPIEVTDTVKPVLESPTMSVGDLTNSTILTNTTNDYLTDDTGQKIPINDVKFDDTYYTDKSATTTATGLVTDGKFTKTGTFYRKVTFTLSGGEAQYITNNNGAVDTGTNTLTYVQPVTIKDGVTESTDTPSVNVGDKVSTSVTTGNTLSNNAGSLIDITKDDSTKGIYKGVSFGSDYYNIGTSTEDILNNKKNATPVSGVVDNGSFAKEGDYLRTITFYLVDSAIDTNNFGTDSTTYKTDVTNNTVTYVQKVHVGPLSSVNVNYGSVKLMTGAATDDPALISTDGDTLTFGTDKTNLIDTTKGSNKDGIDFGQQYFKTLSNGKLSDPVTDFSETGTYYRTIKFYVNKDVDSINFNGTTGTTDSSDNSVTFIQTINVQEVNVRPIIPDLDLQVGVKPATSEDLKLTISGESISKSYTKDSVYYTSLEDAENKSGAIDDPNDKYSYTANTTNVPYYYRYVTFTLNDGLQASNYKFPDVNGVPAIISSDGKSVTYLQRVNVESTLVKAVFSDSISLPIYTNAGPNPFLWDNELSDGGDTKYAAYLGVYPNFDADTSLVNPETSSIPDRNKTLLGHIYYDSAADALADGEAADGWTFAEEQEDDFVVPDGEGTIYRDVPNSGRFEFTKVQDYYRKVSFKLDGPASSYVFDGTEGKDYIISADGKIVTFAQVIHVTGDEATAYMKDKVTFDYADYKNNDMPSDAYLYLGDDENKKISDGNASNQLYATADNAETKSDPVTNVEGGEAYYRVVTLDGNRKYDLYNNNSDNPVNGYAPIIDGNTDTISYIQEVYINPLPVQHLTLNIDSAIADKGEDMKMAIDGNNNITIGGEGYKMVSVTDGDVSVTVAVPVPDDGKNLTFYASQKDALDGENPVSEKTFEMGKTYYLPINAPLIGGNDVNYVWPGVEGEDYKFRTVKISGASTNVATYVQKFEVTDNTVQATVPDINIPSGTKASAIDNDEDNITFMLTGTNKSVVDQDNLELYPDSSGKLPQYYLNKEDAIAAGKGFLKGESEFTDSNLGASRVFSDLGSYYRLIAFLDAGDHTFNDAVTGQPAIKGINGSGNIIVFLQRINVTGQPKETSDKVSSSVGSNVSDAGVGNATSLTIDGKSIVDGTPEVGSDYYAVADNKSTDILNGEGKTTEGVTDGTRFTKTGDYYRVIKFKLNSDINTDYYTFTDGKVSSDTDGNKYVEYVQEVDIIPKATVNITNLHVSTGSSTTITDTTDDSIVDSSNTSLIDNPKDNITFGNVYYTDAKAALNESTDKIADVGSTFTAEGTYYRRITFKLNADASNYTFTDLINGVGHVENGNEVTFVQAVTVEKSTVTATISKLNNIEVGDSTSDVNEEDSTTDSLQDQDKNSIIATIKDNDGTEREDIRFGTEYYGTHDEAIKAGDTDAKGAVSAGDEFTEPKTYFRTITFALKNPSTEYNFAGTLGKDYVLNTDGTISFVQSVTVTAGNINDIIGTGTREVGESLPANDSLGTENDLTLNNGGDSIMTGVTFGDKYYSKKADAVNSTTGTGQDKVSAAGTYYRTITFALKNPASSYKFDGKSGEDYLVSEDGKSVTFAQPINVGKASAISSVKDLNIVAKTLTTDQKVTQTASYTLVGSTSVKAGDTYYKSREGALKDALNPGKDKSLIATDATSGNYFNEGNWYRLIYFTVNDDFFNNYEVSDDNMEKVDNHTVVYAQPVNVSHSTAVTKPEITNGKAIVDNGINTVQSGVNKLLDSNNVVISETPSFGSDYYDNFDDVFATNAAKSAYVVNGVFKKAETYYRKITFTLTDDAIAANNFDAHAHVSGNTVSYVQTVNVAAKTNINIDADSTVDVTAGSAESTLTNDYKLTDDDSNIVGTLSTSDKIAYYGELTDALAQNTKTDSDAISGGSFNAGKYYRLLVFTPNAGVNKDNYSLNNPNLAWSADGTKILFAQEINASANAVSKYNISTPKVTVGSSEKDSETSSGNQIFDHSGKEISASVTFGKDYYANSGDVFDKNVKPVDGVVVDGNFVKVDTYYREIVFHLSHADIVNNSFGNAKVDTNNNTVSYVQAVVVSQSNVARINVNPILINVGTSVDSVKNTDTLTDVTNKSLGTATVDNSKFYDKATDALNGDNVDTNATTNGLFNKGTYYRLVTFKTVSDFAKNYTLNDSNAKMNADGSVTYAQKIDVKANGVVKHNFGDISANIGESTDKIAAATGTLTDASGNEIKASVSAESIYYDNADDVFSSTGKVTEGINAGKQFTRAGTYYREISFKLDGSVDVKNYDFGSDAHVSGNIVSFVQSVVVGENAASITVGPLNIKTGTRTNDQSVTSTDGYVLRAGDDSFTDPTLGMTYYKSVNGALGKSNGDEVDPNAVTAVTDGAFNKGTYYRQVVFKVGNDFADKYNWTDTTNAIYKDGTVIYAQQINVKDSVVSKHTIEDAKANVGDSVTAVTSTGNALMDATGNKLDATVSYGTDYYDNYDDVFTPNAAKTKNVANGAFTKAGTYYRVISFKVSPEAIVQNDFGSEAHISGNTVSFVQAVSVDNKVNVAVNINVTPTITVSADTATNDAKLTKTTGYTLSNNLGTVLATVSAGDKYYTDVQSALKQGDTGLADVNGQFTKAGTYYRVITFKPSKAIDANSISNPNARVNADGTISYVQAVTVTKNATNINSSVGELDLRANAEKDNPALINTKEYSLKDVAGNSLVDKTKGTYGVELGQTFYTDSDLTQKTTDANGARISKAGTYYRIVKFYLTSGAADANQFESIGGTYDATDNSVTFVQMINASAAPSNLAIAKINNVTVDNGTSMTDEALQNDDDVYIVDKNGDSIVANGGVKFDTTLYDSVGRPVTNLKTAGTYNQVVTVKLANDVSAYTFGEGYKVDPTNNTVSYVRTVTVKAASSTGGNTGGNSGNTGGSTGGNSGSSTETDEDDDWNYSPIQGVVTTKTDHQFYTLNNQDNDKIPSRVLGQDSSWKTDQIRVNKAGVTQYRVATGEWIYADDVVLNQNSSEDGDWTYTPVQGVVTTKTDQKKYQLNNHENTAIANRDLKEDSSWKTDLYRTNKEGVRQYRVATGEWIDADDVNFNQDEEDFWTYESVSGVVKTKAGQIEYQLNDQENKAIAHRDLKEETSWKTDLYRTNEAGVKQYRVATGEWIDANDVDFINNNKNDEGWIYTSISGIITTKPNQANYQLNNQNNSAIAGRELIKDSSWKTDQYRTNREGIKQYRVATGEWVDANDVVYEDAVDTGIFRDGRKVSGVINLDRTNIFYDLYSRENEIIEDYSLGEETSWKTDYKAQDVNGDTYYHVGDNEWIKVEKGVHFNNYAWY